MASEGEQAWDELHAATPPGWYVGRPGQTPWRAVSEATPMAGPDELVIREMYASINRRDMYALRKVFAHDAIWHGAGQDVRGADQIAQLVQTLIDASAGTLHIDLHDVVANDEHVVALQTTRAQRGERHLVDQVVRLSRARRPDQRRLVQW